MRRRTYSEITTITRGMELRLDVIEKSYLANPDQWFIAAFRVGLYGRYGRQDPIFTYQYPLHQERSSQFMYLVHDFVTLTPEKEARRAAVARFHLMRDMIEGKA